MTFSEQRTPHEIFGDRKFRARDLIADFAARNGDPVRMHIVMASLLPPRERKQYIGRRLRTLRKRFDRFTVIAIFRDRLEFIIFHFLVKQPLCHGQNIHPILRKLGAAFRTVNLAPHSAP